MPLFNHSNLIAYLIRFNFLSSRAGFDAAPETASKVHKNRARGSS